MEDMMTPDRASEMGELQLKFETARAEADEAYYKLWARYLDACPDQEDEVADTISWELDAMWLVCADVYKKYQELLREVKYFRSILPADDLPPNWIDT